MFPRPGTPILAASHNRALSAAVRLALMFLKPLRRQSRGYQIRQLKAELKRRNLDCRVIGPGAGASDRDIGFPERQSMDDSDQRAPLFDKRDRDRPGPMASHKLARAVDRIDHKDSILRKTRRRVLGFLGGQKKASASVPAPRAASTKKAARPSSCEIGTNVICGSKAFLSLILLQCGKQAFPFPRRRAPSSLAAADRPCLMRADAGHGEQSCIVLRGVIF
jgi:hypothetical protein